MLFAMHWKYAPENRDAVQTRFKETGGAPPEGVRLIGRWHVVGGGEGFGVCEAADASLISLFMQGWTDLMEMRVLPVLDDVTAHAVISKS